MSEPESLLTTMSYRVPYADTDQMGVVYYANFLVYFERLRNEILRDAGVPYTEWEKQGWMLPVVEAHCYYKTPAHYDDLLEFRGWFEWQGAVKIKACAEVWRGDEKLAEGYTLHVAMDAATRRPKRLPKDWRQLFQEGT